MNDFRTPGGVSGSKTCSGCGQDLARWAVHCTHCGKACPTLIGAPAQSCGMLTGGSRFGAPANRSRADVTRAGIAIAGAVTLLSFSGILMVARLTEPPSSPGIYTVAPTEPYVQPAVPRAITEPTPADDPSDYCVEPPPVAYSIPPREVRVITPGLAFTHPMLPPDHPIVIVPAARIHTPIPIRILLLRVPAPASPQAARPFQTPRASQTPAPMPGTSSGPAAPLTPQPDQSPAAPQNVRIPGTTAPTPDTTSPPAAPGAMPDTTAPQKQALGTVQA